ncbi:competence protein CoiA family protein [Streptomyces sp. NPDC002324]
MAFRAVHAEWGTVFSHLPDLGCGHAWEAVWKVRPPAQIACVECWHPMYAKTSERGLKFFAHAPHAPDCEIARQGESEAHHLLKLELASAARDAGADAELEVRAPDGSWRADVLASDPAGRWQMALEAQLSPITVADIAARTERMREHGVTCCWFSDRARPPWLGSVPSLRLTTTGGGLVVADMTSVTCCPHFHDSQMQRPLMSTRSRVDAVTGCTRPAGVGERCRSATVRHPGRGWGRHPNVSNSRSAPESHVRHQMASRSPANFSSMPRSRACMFSSAGSRYSFRKER